MIRTKKIYQNYKIKNNLSIKSKETFGGKGSTADRCYMNKQMKDHFDYFESRKVEEFQNFIKPLHKYGCKTEDQRELFAEFIEYMKINKNIDIFLLKKREMKKANAGERNILMNRIAIEYPNEFMTFLKKFLSQKYPLKLCTKNIIKQFQEKVKKLIQPQTLNVSTLFDSLNYAEFCEIISDQASKTELFDNHCELFCIF